MSWNEPGGDNKDPWSGRGNDNKTPPDLDEVFRSIQGKLAKFFGGDKDNGDGEEPAEQSSGNPIKGLAFLAGGVFILWGLSGFYIVDEGNNGVVTRFGKYTQTTQSGLNWHIPVPIESVDIVNVKQQHFIEVGYRGVAGGEQTASSVPKEALMLTEDENIVDVRLTVQYQVDNARDFLFNVANPVATLKQVTESVQRGVIGSHNMDFILTEGRTEIIKEIEEKIRTVMERYHSGILVTGVNLQDAQPPEQVQNAFVDAIKAREDKETKINQALAYASDVKPKARGAAARKLQEAEGYQQQVIAQAEGNASRFLQLLEPYKKAPEIMRKRMYIESIESVLSEANTVLVNVKEGSNNMLYLPLDKMIAPQSATNNPAPADAVAEKPVVVEKPAAFNRGAVRGRNPRGRNDAE